MSQKDTNVTVHTGRLVGDPELVTLNSGTSKCTFRIAVNRGNDREKNDLGAYFFNVIVWGAAGENCATHLVKGQQVTVTGELTSREWEAQDGSKRYAVEIKAQPMGVQFGAKPRGASAEESQGAEMVAAADAGTGEDDIPF